MVVVVLSVGLTGCDGSLITHGASTEENRSVLEADALGKAEPRSLQGQLTRLLARQAPRQGLAFYRMPLSDELHKLPQDPKNPLTPEKVRLGRLLFHETALLTDHRLGPGQESASCASCHFAQAGFQANLPQGIGEGGVGFGRAGETRRSHAAYDGHPDTPLDVQPIRSPSAMNAAFQELMLWNGQFAGIGDNVGTEAGWTGPKASNFLGLHGLETQAHAALEVHRMQHVEQTRVYEIPAYKALFSEAFPGEASPIHRYNTALAIAAYERTLLANESPWQRWLRGDKQALSDEHLRGALLFFGKAACSSCHTGPALNSMTFHALGMNDLDGSADPRVDLSATGGTIPDDVRQGRGGFTGHAEDLFTWKTPQLYNLTDSRFYGHGASFTSVRDVVAYKNAAVAENPYVSSDQLSPAFRPLGLSEAEIDALTAFLEEALHDPYLMRYVPTSLPSGNCFPNNDPESQQELGNCLPSSVPPQ